MHVLPPEYLKTASQVSRCSRSDMPSRDYCVPTLTWVASVPFPPSGKRDIFFSQPRLREQAGRRNARARAENSGNSARFVSSGEAIPETEDEAEIARVFAGAPVVMHLVVAGAHQNI